jgi:hypothetical protein
VELKCAGTHDGTSHVEDKSKYLTNAQKGFLKRSTKSAPNETGRAHVRNSCNFSPDKRTPQDPTSIRCAQRVVVKQRRAIALNNTQGVKLDDTHGPLTRLCNKLDFIQLIARHNDPDDEYHLDLHSVICLGAQWKGGNTFMETSTVDLLLNVGRAIGSKWELHIQSDGTFGLCASDIGVINFGVNSLRGIFRQVSWSIVANESSEAFAYCYNGIRAAFFKLLTPGEVRLCPISAKCQCCQQIREVQAMPEVIKVLNDPNKKLPVKKAGADNTTKWSKFARQLIAGAKVLICYAHATGNDTCCMMLAAFDYLVCTGIPWQRKSFREQFDSAEKHHEFHQLLSRAILCPTPDVARLVQHHLVLLLKSWGEDAAASWFETYWCGSRGTWTIGDAGVGHVAHNNGVEGNWPAFIMAVCGSAGKNKNMKMDVFVGNMLKYVSDQSKEKALAQQHTYGTHLFLSNPEMSPQQWQSIQHLDIRLLEHAHIYGSEDKRRKWRRWMHTLAEIEGPHRTPPGGALLTQQIQIFHETHP